MKKITLTFALITITFLSYGQQWLGSTNSLGNISRRGNVGIGLFTPSERLDVRGNIKASGFVEANTANFRQSLANGSFFSSIQDRNSRTNVLRAGTQLTASASILNVLDIPQSNLDSQAISLIGMEDRNTRSRWRFTAYTGGMSQLRYYDKNQSVFYDLTEDGNGAISLLLPKNNSSVGIGTANPDAKLTVKGDIHAEEVRVDLNVPADYVFEKYYNGYSFLKEEYTMPTLEEVAIFTKENNHLPGVPSAKEIQKEGLHLKEMTNLLLQKIEELTLYTIEQENRIKKLEKIISINN